MLFKLRHTAKQNNCTTALQNGIEVIFAHLRLLAKKSDLLDLIYDRELRLPSHFAVKLVDGPTVVYFPSDK